MRGIKIFKKQEIKNFLKPDRIKMGVSFAIFIPIFMILFQFLPILLLPILLILNLITEGASWIFIFMFILDFILIIFVSYFFACLITKKYYKNKSKRMLYSIIIIGTIISVLFLIWAGSIGSELIF